MIPPLIVERARELSLGLIAVTDHNSAENASAVVAAAQGSELTVLPGMEVETKEEVHVVCLFDTVDQALEWQEVVYSHLPPARNNPEFFGEQFVVDAQGDFVRRNERLLATSTSLSVEQVTRMVTERAGLCIAAHVDRPSYSLLANLGLVPPGAQFAAMEVTPRASIIDLPRMHPSLAGYTLIRSGDVHRLSEMGNSAELTVAARTIAELSMAFRGEGGRKVTVLCS